MSGSSPFPVKLRKTKVDSEKKSTGKFEVKLKKVKKAEDEKKDGVGFGVSLKKVNPKKDAKEGGLELPKLKKTNKGGKEDDSNEKTGFKLKKISKGPGIDDEEDLDSASKPFAVKLKKSKKDGVDDDGDASSGATSGRDALKPRADRKLGENDLEALEDELKKIELRKMRPSEAKLAKLASMTEEEKAEYLEKKRAKKIARKQKKMEEVQLKKTSRSQREGEEKSGIDVNLKRVSKSGKEAEEKQKLDVNLKRVDRRQRDEDEKNKIDRNLKRVDRNYGEEEEEERQKAQLRRVERGEKELNLSEREKVELRKAGKKGEKEIGDKIPRGQMLDGADFSDSDFDSSDDDFAPRAPSAPLARMMTGKEVHVSWKSKAGADDDLIGYDVERRTNQKGDWIKINESLVEATHYLDSEAKVGEVYNYRVIARNEDGASAASPPSAPIRVKRQRPQPKEQMNKVATAPGFDIGPDFDLSEEAPLALPALPKGKGENSQRVIRVKRGDPAPISLPITGYPIPKISWTKDGGVVPGHIDLWSSEMEAGFFIGACDNSDAATYKCRLENDKGNNEFQFKLIVCVTPGTPEGPLQVTEIGDSSVSLAWKPPKDDGGAQLQGYIVEKATADDPDNWTEVGVTEECKISAENLKKCEEYTFRVSAESEAGKSDFLELDESVQVKKETASSPQDVSASSEPPTSALISWQPPVEKGESKIVAFIVEKRDVGTSDATSGSGRRDEVEAQVLRDRLNEDKEVGWEEAVRVDGDKLQALVENLDPNRKYQFRVIPEHAGGARGGKSVPSLPFNLKSSERAKGNQVKSGEEKARTPVVGPPGRPENVLASKVRREGVGLTWEEPTSDGGSPITGYIVEKRESGGCWSRVNIKIHPRCSLEVDDVRPGDPVRFRVSAVNAIGTGEPSKPTNTVIVPELSRADLNPGKPDVTSVTTTSVSLQWPPPAVKDDILGFVVEVKMPNGHWVRANENLTTINSFMVTNLCENQRYEFRVCVVDKSGGQIGVSRPCEATTKAEVKDDPSRLAMFDTTTLSASSSAAHIQWHVSPKQNDNYDKKIPIVAFVVEVKQNDGNWERLPSLVTTRDFVTTDLVPGFSYQFRVLGVSSENLTGFPGSPSDAVLAADPPSAPVMAASLAPITVLEGANLAIAAPFKASPIPAAEWKKGEATLANVERIFGKVSENRAELSIPYCKRKDSGFYRVTLSNSVGKAECCCQVTVLGTPSAPNGPLSAAEVKEESMIVQWSMPDDDGGSPITGYRIETRKRGKKCWRLVESCCPSISRAVAGLSAATDYEFRVCAANAVGLSPPLLSDQPLSTRLHINEDNSEDAVKKTLDRLSGPAETRKAETRPCFTFGLRPRIIQKSNSVKLICCLQGNPKPKVVWSKDGKEIDGFNPQFSKGVKAGVCSLEVSICRRENAGVYTCTAMNKLGRDETRCKLVVEDVRSSPLNRL